METRHSHPARNHHSEYGHNGLFCQPYIFGSFRKLLLSLCHNLTLPQQIQWVNQPFLSNTCLLDKEKETPSTSSVKDNVPHSYGNRSVVVSDVLNKTLKCWTLIQVDDNKNHKQLLPEYQSNFADHEPLLLSAFP